MKERMKIRYILKSWVLKKITALGLTDPFHRNVIIVDDGAGHYLRIPKLTTAERNALTGVNGMLVYDKTLNQFYRYENSGWIAIVNYVLPTALTCDTLVINGGAGHYLILPSLTTTQRNALTPTEGMIVYDITLHQLYIYQTASWTIFTTGPALTNITTITGTGGPTIDLQTVDAINITSIIGARTTIQTPSNVLFLTSGSGNVEVCYLYPRTDNSYTLGYAGSRWLKLYLSQIGGIHDGSYWRNFLTLNQGLNHQMNYIPDTALLALGSTVLGKGIGLIAGLNQGNYSWDTEYNAWSVMPTIGLCGYHSYWKIYGAQTYQVEFKKPLGQTGIGTHTLDILITDPTGDNSARLDADPGHPTKWRITTTVSGVSYLTLDNITIDTSTEKFFSIKVDSVSTRYYSNGTLIATEITHKLPLTLQMHAQIYSNDGTDTLTVYEMDHVIGVL